MTKYQVVNKFLGYRRKTDETNLPPGVLVKGSQNVLLNDGERVAVRKGYTLDGQANASLTPILSSYDWLDRHLGDEQHLRSYYNELEYRYVNPDGSVTWNRLRGGWGDFVNFNYTEFWNVTESIDTLLLVNGTNHIYEWSGAITTFASATTNTITKQGTESWAELGFFTANTRELVIDGIVYTYTGGEGTTTLTGVTPDPTLGGISVGDVIVQNLRTFINGSTLTGLALEKNDLISTLYNQVYVGDLNNRQVYVSQVDNFQDYTFASPRLPSEGALLTLDAPPVGFAPQEDSEYISAGKSQWYKVDFILSADQQSETIAVSRLKTTSQSGAKSQAFISKMKNYVFFLTNEPTLDTLGKLELINSPQSVNLSDPIKTDFDSYDFTGGSCFYDRNFLYLAIPAEGIVRIFNLAMGFWEAPQILPISRFSLIDGELYGHSSQVPETYKLFDSYSDNGNPINAIAAFSYQNFGDRANQKNFNEFYNEGYMSSNTNLQVTNLYNYMGTGGSVTKTISGSDLRAVVPIPGDGSLGKQSLGKRSLAGRGNTVDQNLPPKFRVIKTFPKTDFYEVQTQYSSNDVDQRWELLAFGPNAQMSTTENFVISE